jgi:GH18 family chitinase
MTSTAKYLELGVPPEKLAIGLAFYGRVFGKTNFEERASGIFEDCSWCYSFPGVPGVVNYFGVKTELLDKGMKMNNMDWVVCRDD